MDIDKIPGVGVTAYLGAAASIIDKDYLTAAGSILTIESRHSSYLRAALAESPFPQHFDVPLDFDEVFTLAAPMIVSCPASNPPLPVKAFPELTLETTGSIMTGSTITLLTTAQPKSGNGQLFGAFITVSGPIFVPAIPVAGGFNVVVPAGVEGQSYVVLTPCQDEADDDNIVAGPAIVEVG